MKILALTFLCVAPVLGLDDPGTPPKQVEDAPAPSGAKKADKPPPAPPGGRPQDSGKLGSRVEPEEPGTSTGGASEREHGRGEAVEAQIREIEDALWREIESIESRLRAIKEHLLVLTERDAPRTPRPAAPSRPPGQADEGDEKRHNALLKRQENLLGRWQALSTNETKKAGKEEKAEGTRERIRAQLRDVISEILDLRERARERQVERLRAELEDIERGMRARRRQGERREMVESRLEELLGGRGEKRP